MLPDDVMIYVTSFGLIHTETVPILRLKGIVVQIQPRRVGGQIGELEDWLETNKQILRPLDPMARAVQGLEIRSNCHRP